MIHFTTSKKHYIQIPSYFSEDGTRSSFRSTRINVWWSIRYDLSSYMTSEIEPVSLPLSCSITLFFSSSTMQIYILYRPPYVVLYSRDISTLCKYWYALIALHHNDLLKTVSRFLPDFCHSNSRIFQNIQ